MVPKIKVDEIINLKVQVPKSFHRKLSRLAAGADMTLRQAVTNAIGLYLPKLESIANKKDEDAA